MDGKSAGQRGGAGAWLLHDVQENVNGSALTSEEALRSSMICLCDDRRHRLRQGMCELRSTAFAESPLSEVLIGSIRRHNQNGTLCAGHL